MLVSGVDDNYSFFCVVNGILYETETAIKTLDVTFKVIFGLDLQYQAQCKHVWQCIEKVFYEMQIEKNYSISTDIVVNRIKQKMNKL